jgi:hypothetical protein
LASFSLPENSLLKSGKSKMLNQMNHSLILLKSKTLFQIQEVPQHKAHFLL